MPSYPLPPWIPRDTGGINNLIGMALMGGGGGGSPAWWQGGASGEGLGTTSPLAEGRGGTSNGLVGLASYGGIGNALANSGSNPFASAAQWWNSTPVGGLQSGAANTLAQASSGVGSGISNVGPSPWDRLNQQPAWPGGAIGGSSPYAASGPGFMAAYGGGSIGGGTSGLGELRGIPTGNIPNFGGGGGGGGGGSGSFWDWIKSLFK